MSGAGFPAISTVPQGLGDRKSNAGPVLGHTGSVAGAGDDVTSSAWTGPRSLPPVDPQADEWLVAHAAGGDRRAYEELVRRHQDRIYRIAYRMLGNRHDAEDVAQEVLLQLWISLASFLNSASFTTWLYRSVVNRTISLTRKPHRRVERPENDQSALEVMVAGSTSPSGEDVSLAGERSRAIAAAVGELSPDLRAVFVLRHFEGLSYEQIGEILDLPEPTVRGRLARSRQQLTTRLKEWR